MTTPDAQPARLPRQVAALLFDLDGTLYAQGPVRRRIAWALLRAHAASPRVGLSTVRMLRAYRGAQEVLRDRSRRDVDEHLDAAQLRFAAAACGESPARVAASVARWMLSEPLPMLIHGIRPGLITLLEWAADRGVALGVVSDYPAAEKLHALGVARYFDVVVTAQDPEVQRFKPDPRGLVTALQRLGVPPDRALYFGDRPEVDGVAADRAGVACVLVGRRRPQPWPAVADFTAALTLLEGG